MKRYLASMLLLPLLMLFTSCGTMAKLSDNLAEARDIAIEAKQASDTLQPEVKLIVELVKELGEIAKNLGSKFDGYKEDFLAMKSEFEALSGKEKAEADRNGDGELSWSEMILYGLGVSGSGAVILRKYLQKLKERLLAEATSGASASVQEALAAQAKSAKVAQE